jgi:hypothetical protein
MNADTTAAHASAPTLNATHPATPAVDKVVAKISMAASTVPRLNQSAEPACATPIENLRGPRASVIRAASSNTASIARRMTGSAIIASAVKRRQSYRLRYARSLGESAAAMAAWARVTRASGRPFTAFSNGVKSRRRAAGGIATVPPPGSLTTSLVDGAGAGGAQPGATKVP